MDERQTIAETPPPAPTSQAGVPTQKIAAPVASAPPAPADPKIGQMLGGYEIVRLLGRGGMGAVYLAKQVKLDRLVVVKVIAPELAAQPDIVGRLQREARAAAKISS